jgi:hypothetical protein
MRKNTKQFIVNYSVGQKSMSSKTTLTNYGLVHLDHSQSHKSLVPFTLGIWVKRHVVKQFTTIRWLSSSWDVNPWLLAWMGRVLTWAVTYWQCWFQMTDSGIRLTLLQYLYDVRSTRSTLPNQTTSSSYFSFHHCMVAVVFVFYFLFTPRCPEGRGLQALFSSVGGLMCGSVPFCHLTLVPSRHVYSFK